MYTTDTQIARGKFRGFHVGGARLGGVRIFDARITNVKTLFR